MVRLGNVRTQGSCGGSTRAGHFVASLMLGLWLQVLGLAVVPDFHDWLHADSEDSAHECPVTLLSKGDVVPGSASPAAVQIPLIAGSLAPHDAPHYLPTERHRLGQSRAPPTRQGPLVFLT